MKGKLFMGVYDTDGQERTPELEAQAQIIAAANIASPIVYFIVCVLLKHLVLEGSGGFVDLPEMIILILFGVGLATTCSSAYGAFWLRSFLLSKYGQSLQAKNQAVLMAMVVADMGALFGMVLFLISGNLPFASVLMAISFVAKLLLFPSRNWLRAK